MSQAFDAAVNAMHFANNDRAAFVKKKTKLHANAARYEAALTAAFEAARVAQSGMVENMNALDCGFAWSVSHDKGFNSYCRTRLAALSIDAATYSERKRYGSKHYGPGWCFWSPGPFNGQSIGIHRAGAQAFSDALAHALQCRVETGSRLD